MTFVALLMALDGMKIERRKKRNSKEEKGEERERSREERSDKMGSTNRFPYSFN